MAQRKSRQTFEKFKREQAVRERRARKQERREAARMAKAAGPPPVEPGAAVERVDHDHVAEPPAGRHVTVSPLPADADGSG